MSTKPGRPKEAKTAPREQAIVSLSRCPLCDSTQRTAYSGEPVVTEYLGLHDGKPFTHIVRRRTSCTNCTQCRFDVSHENRQTEKETLSADFRS